MRGSLDDRGVTALTELQTWTVIGGFLTAIFAMLGLVTSSFNRTVRSEIGRVEGRIDALGVEMRTGFRRIDDRFDHLDRDVQALTRHVFGRPE